MFPDTDVSIRQVDKLQGESYKGLNVRYKDSNTGLSMNLSKAFESLQNGENSLGEILREVMDAVRNALQNIPKFDPADLSDYQQVKEHLVMQLIPREANQKMLKGIPHKTMEDLAAVYRVELNDPGHEYSALITNEMLKDFGITAEELHRDAVISQIKHCPPTLENLSEIMTKMSGGVIDVPESPLWVASVEGGMHGAAAVVLPEFLEQAAEKLGGDFFILPSSVHECLFIPDDGKADRKDLERMVRSVNRTEVSERDFLSNSVYHYDSIEKLFEKAENFESRVAEEAMLYHAAHEKDTMHVLLVEPDKHPRQVEIGTNLEDLQAAVGGFIEATYPFMDDVALIVNDEGKINGMPLNRALRDESGEIYDIVAGPFLVVGLTEDDFGSLTPEQMAAYEEKFHNPEIFVRMGRGIAAIPVPDEITGSKEPFHDKAVQKQHREEAR
jgi:hypothetical protein